MGTLISRVDTFGDIQEILSNELFSTLKDGPIDVADLAAHDFFRPRLEPYYLETLVPLASELQHWKLIETIMKLCPNILELYPNSVERIYLSGDVPGNIIETIKIKIMKLW